MSDSLVISARHDDVAVISLDDGKANALSHAVIAALRAEVAAASGDASAIAISGREGRFSAGFDLSVMREGPEAARDLVRAGAELALEIFEAPVPVVVGCTGHALAMGAILLLAADVRIGAEGDFKIGMNEVSIGMPLPIFGTELARDRLSKRHFTRAVSHAHIYDPAAAIDAGLLDEVVAPDEVTDTARGRAADLAERLDAVAFAKTRQHTRRDVAAFIRARLDEDLQVFDITPG